MLARVLRIERADEYFERMINGRWKHPNIVRSRIEKDIKPHLGKLALDGVGVPLATLVQQRRRHRAETVSGHFVGSVA